MTYIGLPVILVSVSMIPKVWFSEWPLWAKFVAHLFLCFIAVVASATLLPS